MKKILKTSCLVLAAALATGCASTSDIDHLQAQINDLKSQVSTTASDASAAKTAAADASAKAAAAEEAANRAARYAQDTNSKLDNMFKKTMMK